jgi:BioD-like phosphotransacetylase family protein
MKMIALYVVSTEAFSGKSAVCLALGKRLMQDGFAVGYLKPMSTAPQKVDVCLVDEDAMFMKQALGLAESLEAITPIMFTPAVREAAMAGEDKGFPEKLQAAYQGVAKGKDVVLLEGGHNLAEGALIDLSAPQTTRLLDARVLLVARYIDGLTGDDLLAAKSMLGDAVVGAVLNAVPSQNMDFVEEKGRPCLERHSIPVLAILPQERVLLSVTVGEIAECLGGEILCATEHADELVENLMIGAMSVESALSYFSRKLNKAVITGGDRPDIQLAALETSTKCIVLTGNHRPNPIVLSRSEEKGVPMIMVSSDTLSTVEALERFFGRSRFHQEKKVLRFERLFGERFDFARLYRALGLKK